MKPRKQVRKDQSTKSPSNQANNPAHDGHGAAANIHRPTPALAARLKAARAKSFRSRDVWSRFDLACRLDATAQEAAGLLRSMAKELFHLHQALPRWQSRFERVKELDARVNKLADALSYGASSKIEDAMADVVDDGSHIAFPVPPNGFTAEEMLVIECLDESSPIGVEPADLMNYLVWHSAREFSGADFANLFADMAERDIIETRDKDGKMMVHLTKDGK